MEQVRAKERQKRGKYDHYDAECKARSPSTRANTETITQELGHCVSESSVRNMKKTYFLKLNSVPDPADITSLPHAALGRPLLVGSELDVDIAEYVRALRLAGGIVNCAKFNVR